MATKVQIIEILDQHKGLVKIDPNKKYKLVNPDGKDVGGFIISGTPAVVGEIDEQDGLVSLAGVPYMGQKLFIDVNNDAGSMTKIKNLATNDDYLFQVVHPDLGKKPVNFEGWDSKVLNPKPTKITWKFYNPAEKADRIVTINITPLPNEHAIEIRFTIK